MILLGWEIGTGNRVEIPEYGHLAWFGQTQLSGKTTALEAIAFRGELKAVAFITKQGEGGFLTGRMIPPYFSEPTNDEEQPLWRWVKSILEASQQRRMNFEESWIIRACEDPKPAKTLADVHANIKALLQGESILVTKGRGKRAKVVAKTIRRPVTGMNAGIYTSLKAYFDIVMPQLARLPYTKKLELLPGLNVMNLQAYAMETQALVIRSVMEWVYLHEKNVRVIVPEAQDFVPQGKNSPVKMACETLVRKAGANKNFMWLDSQDMAAVDKIMLRACSIVGIGVQTEAHEIDRSLAGLFMPSLRAIDIARLKIGEFFVRTSEAKVSKVYVQPAWMNSELHAQEIAKGHLPVSGARDMQRAFKKSREAIQEPPHVEEKENQSGEIIEHAVLQATGSGRTKDSMRLSASVPIPHGNDRPGRERDSDPDNGERDAGGSPSPARGQGSDAPAVTRNNENSHIEEKEKTESEEVMPQIKSNLATMSDLVRSKFLLAKGERRSDCAEVCELLISYDNLVQTHDALAERLSQLEQSAGSRALVPAGGNGAPSMLNPEQKWDVYKYVKEQAAKDPGVLELLTHAPELRVKVERHVIHANGNNLDGRIALLVREGFFDKPRDRSSVGEELRRRGALAATANLKILSPFLSKLTSMGFLRNEPTGFQAVPDMKVSIEK